MRKNVIPSQYFFHLLVFCFEAVPTCLQDINRQTFDEIGNVVKGCVHVEVRTSVVRNLLLVPQREQILCVLSHESSFFVPRILPRGVQTHAVDDFLHQIANLVSKK